MKTQKSRTTESTNPDAGWNRERRRHVRDMIGDAESLADPLGVISHPEGKE
jgi:hypothetical protein